MKKKVKLKFNISINDFITEMKLKLGFMKRDIAEFNKYNVTETDITAVETQLEEFAEMPTDDELVGAQKETTEAKNKAAEQLRENIDAVVSRADMAFGSNSGKYRKFGVKALSKLDGGELSVAARRVYRVGKEYQEDLTQQGLTESMLEDLVTNRQKYDTSIEIQEDAIANREIATEDRNEKANEIYDIVVGYCSTGRKIWEDTNQARYNDYIIYDSVPEAKSEEEEGQSN